MKFEELESKLTELDKLKTITNINIEEDTNYVALKKEIETSFPGIIVRYVETDNYIEKTGLNKKIHILTLETFNYEDVKIVSTVSIITPKDLVDNLLRLDFIIFTRVNYIVYHGKKVDLGKYTFMQASIIEHIKKRLKAVYVYYMTIKYFKDDKEVKISTHTISFHSQWNDITKK